MEEKQPITYTENQFREIDRELESLKDIPEAVRGKRFQWLYLKGVITTYQHMGVTNLRVIDSMKMNNLNHLFQAYERRNEKREYAEEQRLKSYEMTAEQLK